MKKKNIGSTFDSWLREEGLYEEVNVSAAKRRVDRADLERINAAADELNPAVESVLKYQSLDDPSETE
jgi:hypothetical protein